MLSGSSSNSSTTPVVVVILPTYENTPRNVSWFRPAASAGFQPNDIVFSTVEKLVAAKAKVFLGTHRSTFSWDIDRLRHGFGLSDCRDRNLRGK